MLFECLYVSHPDSYNPYIACQTLVIGLIFLCRITLIETRTVHMFSSLPVHEKIASKIYKFYAMLKKQGRRCVS